MSDVDLNCSGVNPQYNGPLPSAPPLPSQESVCHFAQQFPSAPPTTSNHWNIMTLRQQAIGTMLYSETSNRSGINFFSMIRSLAEIFAHLSPMLSPQPAVRQAGLINRVTIINNPSPQTRTRTNGDEDEDRMSNREAVATGFVASAGVVGGMGFLGKLYKTISEANASNDQLDQLSGLDFQMNAYKNNLKSMNNIIKNVAMIKGSLTAVGVGAAAACILGAVKRSKKMRDASFVVSLAALGVGVFCYTAGILDAGARCKSLYNQNAGHP